jgi:ubiquinone/menaquinone biosynthesis C-methylase UbiE
MRVALRQCPIDRRPLPQRAASAAARPLKRYLSQQAAHPHGIGGRLIGRLWITETAAVNDAAIELLAPSRGEHILEIGFGPGRALGLISSRGASATGIDVSEAMVTLAGQRNRDQIRTGALRLCVSDGVTIPLADDSVDAVLSVHNVYFWAEPHTTIEEIARVLRPGGRVLLVFRGREHPLLGRLDPTIYRSVTTNDVETWLLDADFTDIGTRSPSSPPAEISFVVANLRP